jgi:hypothetical protein
MNCKKFIPTVFFLIFTLSISAQITVSGIVRDTNQMPLIGATTVVQTAADSLLSGFAITDSEGKFEIKKVKPGDYLIQITYLGFETFTQPFSVEKDQAVIELGDLTLLPENTILDEVLVEGEIIPIIIKKDTIEYNADAFKTKPNAVVEDLLRKLPGVEVQRDGSIKAQGEQVDKVLVDGKEFFGNDPKMATKNLPADAIDKVQVFDKQSEMAEFSGIDDGREEKTINLALKEDKKNGYFGKASAGYGSSGRYEGRGNINRFSPKSQVSAIGMMNNTNQQGFSLNDYINFMGGLQNLMTGGRLTLDGSTLGMPIDMGGNNGIMTTWAGGLNFNREFGKKTELNGSYFYNRIQNDLDRSLYTQSFLNESSFTADEVQTQRDKSTNHRLNLNLRQEIDSSQNLRLRASLGFNDGRITSIQESETFNALNELENAGLYDNFSDGDRMDWNANLIYRRRFKKAGRVISTDWSAGMRNENRIANLFSVNSFFPTDPDKALIDSLEQEQDYRNDQVNYSGRFSYTEPLGKKKYLELNYAHQNFNDDLVKDFYDIFQEQNPRAVFNPLLSRKYVRDYIYNRGGLNFRLNTKKSNFSTGISLQQSLLKGQTPGLDDQLSRTFTYWLPRLSWGYDISNSSNFELNYRTSIREPNLEQLQPVVDNSNPLSVYIGNPGLQPEYNHRVDMQYMTFDQFSMTNVFVNASMTYTQDRISYDRSVDSLFRQTIRPINTKDELLGNVNVSFSTPLRFIKSRINLNGSSIYNKGRLFVNTVENQYDRLVNRVDVTIENRKKEVLDIMVGASFSNTTTKYKLESQMDQQFLTQQYYTDISVDFAKTWTIGTSFDYNIYSGAAFAEEQTIPLWRASLSKFFLKNQKGQLTLSVFDILNQNQGINRNSELNYIQEERIRAIGRYVMLSFTYSLSGFGNENNGISIETVGRR